MDAEVSAVASQDNGPAAKQAKTRSPLAPRALSEDQSRTHPASAAAAGGGSPNEPYATATIAATIDRQIQGRGSLSVVRIPDPAAALPITPFGHVPLRGLRLEFDEPWRIVLGRRCGQPPGLEGLGRLPPQVRANVPWGACRYASCSSASRSRTRRAIARLRFWSYRSSASSSAAVASAQRPATRRTSPRSQSASAA